MHADNLNVQAMKLILYMRKSNESEEKQELSIPAQQRELTALATRMGLNVVATFDESMSAKYPGRPVFDKVMKMIQTGKADGVLAWHLDRLARNPKDGGDVMWLLGQRTMKAIVTPGQVFTGEPNDKLLMSIIFGMSTKYSDDLSINIRRGNREALEQGRWIGRPKIGYMRDQVTGQIVRDPATFELVREIWNLRLRGVPVLDILERARNWGLKTRQYKIEGGYALAPSQMYKLLKEKFYFGVMVSAGVEYRGAHEPMITVDEYERVQALNAGKAQDGPRSRERFFTYQGLIRCGECNAIVTRDEKTNRFGSRYTYYRCCRKKRKYTFCKQAYIEVEELEQQILTFLGSIQVSDKLVKFVLKRLPEAEETRKKARRGIEAQLTKESKENATRLARLRQLCVDGVIGTDEFAADRSRLLADEQRLREQLGHLESADQLVEPLRAAFSFVNEAKKLFECGNSEEKRAILQSVSSNLLLKDKTLLIEAKKPFAFFQQRERFSTGCTLWEAIHHLMVHEPETIREIDGNVRRLAT